MSRFLWFTVYVCIHMLQNNVNTAYRVTKDCVFILCLSNLLFISIFVML